MQASSSHIARLAARRVQPGCHAKIASAHSTVMSVDVERRKCTEAEIGCSERERFIIELEFIQSLSNPHYLNWLAQNRYLEDQAFVNYLKYLSYWKQPEYVKYLVYPHCLHFLDLLQNPEFGKAIVRANVAEFIHTQQHRFWMGWWNERMKEGAGAGEAGTAAAAEGATGAGSAGGASKNL